MSHVSGSVKPDCVLLRLPIEVEVSRGTQPPQRGLRSWQWVVEGDVSRRGKDGEGVNTKRSMRDPLWTVWFNPLFICYHSKLFRFSTKCVCFGLFYLFTNCFNQFLFFSLHSRQYLIQFLYYPYNSCWNVVPCTFISLLSF